MSAAVPAPSRWALAVAMGTVYLIWGSTYLAIRIAVQGLPPFVGAAMRFGAAGAILLLLAVIQGNAKPSWV